MTTPVIAPYVQSSAQYTPYITNEEFLAAPTGVDTSQLIPTGTSMSQDAALTQLIARASGHADKICQKVLAATIDIEAGEYRIRSDNTLRIPLKYTPLLAVLGVSVGFTAKTLTPLADLSGIWPGPKAIRVPVPGPALLPPLAFMQYPPAAARTGCMFAQVTYVNGWAHSTLSAATLAGAQSIAPVNTAGFVAGLTFTVRDGADEEQAQVDPSYVYGSATVPLVSPLQYAHTGGTTVSAQPPVIKDAVLDLCKWLVKSRGSKGVVLGSLKGQPVSAANAKQQPDIPAGSSDYKNAVAALTPFRRAR